MSLSTRPLCIVIFLPEITVPQRELPAEKERAAAGLNPEPTGVTGVHVEFVTHATIRDSVGQKRLEREFDAGTTVGEALSVLADDHESLGPLLFDGDGDLRPHVNVLVDEENVRNGDGAATVLADGSTVTLAPGVSGGRD
jgi:molybdopterin synthase sulfur carrier subunit